MLSLHSYFVFFFRSRPILWTVCTMSIFTKMDITPLDRFLSFPFPNEQERVLVKYMLSWTFDKIKTKTIPVNFFLTRPVVTGQKNKMENTSQSTQIHLKRSCQCRHSDLYCDITLCSNLQLRWILARCEIEPCSIVKVFYVQLVKVTILFFIYTVIML